MSNTINIPITKNTREGALKAAALVLGSWLELTIASHIAGYHTRVNAGELALNILEEMKPQLSAYEYEFLNSELQAQFKTALSRK